jgi:germination protein M
MRMNFYRVKVFKRGVMLLFLLPLLSACSQGLSTHQVLSERIDPPPSDVEQVMIQNASKTTFSAGREEITVYLLDRNGYLAPMSLKWDTEQSTPQSSVEKAIAWMTVNEQLADQLPSGFKALLPQGTKVSSVKENKETIAVDFAVPFLGTIASQERKIIEALVWTLTEIPGINKVKLSVAGKPIQSLPSSGLPIDTTLTRGLGINLETAEGVQPNRAMGVTLYFSSQSADGEGYFVPVTRLINRQTDPAKAALEQLILGPQNLRTLKAVLTSDMTIEMLTQMADTVNVSLQNSDWTPNSPLPAEMMKALVLTLTEVTGVPQVRVVMNGDDSLVDTDQQSYEYPVTRPISINSVFH